MPKGKQKNNHNTNWTAVAGVVVAFLIGLIGMGFSYQELKSVNTSLEQSQASLSILANKEGVYLEPVIVIDAFMYKNSHFGYPKLLIFNNGKVEAVNIVVQIIRRQFDGGNFIGSSYRNQDLYVFDEIKTYEIKEVVLPDEYIVDPEYNTIEVRVYYMREYDKQTYSYRTFFFYGPEERDFKSWFNIKQAKLLEGNPFTNFIEESLKLPINLYEGLENMLGTELYEF